MKNISTRKLLAGTFTILALLVLLVSLLALRSLNAADHRFSSYVAGIAAIYVLMGVLAAFIGGGVNLQAIFNQWYILVPFALLFVVLAASMFGLFTI